MASKFLDLSNLSYRFYGFHCGTLNMEVRYYVCDTETYTYMSVKYDVVNHEIDERVITDDYEQGNMADADFNILTDEIRDYILSNDFLYQVRDSAFEFLRDAVEVESKTDRDWSVA